MGDTNEPNQPTMPTNWTDLLGAKTVHQFYLDLLSKPVQEVGEILTDIIKTARLFSFPFQYGALGQDMFTNHLYLRLKAIKDKVPEAKQIEGKATFTVPLIQQLGLVDDKDYLRIYYLNLLEKSINADKVQLAHPAFPTVIHQLSRDEIILLEAMMKEPIIISYEHKGRDKMGAPINEIILDSTFDLKTLHFPDLRGMYFEHLELLNLSIIKSHVPESANAKTLLWHRTMRFQMTKFGKLFMEACS